MLTKMLDIEMLDEEKVFSVVQKTNNKLSPFNMMIRAGIDEITNEKYYVLISTVDNMLTRAASLYNSKEKELFRRSLQAMVNDPRSTIDFSDFTGIAIKAGVPVADRRRLFDEWRRKHWFTTVTEDTVTLGVRSMTELDVYIKEHLLIDPNDFDLIIRRQRKLRKETQPTRRDERRSMCKSPHVRVKQQRSP